MKATILPPPDTNERMDRMEEEDAPFLVSAKVSRGDEVIAEVLTEVETVLEVEDTLLRVIDDVEERA